MNEGPCDRFEVAVEMRLHGELDRGSGAELDAHLASCPSCREFEARAGTIDRVLREGAATEEQDMDWRALRARVTGWRSRDLLLAIVAAVIVLGSTLDNWLARLARPNDGAPDSAPLPFGVLLTAALVAFLVWNMWANVRDVRRATSPTYLTRLYRQDLAGRIRNAHVLAWLAPPYLFLLVITFTRLDLAKRLLDLGFLAILAWERFVVVPRLEREERELPIFDDFPHLF